MTPATKAVPSPPCGAPRRRLGFLRSRNPRGSVLVVALLVAALIALALGSYLNLNLTSARLAHRSFQQHAAFNLAEAGAEEALWSFNQSALHSPEAWTDWTRDGGAAWRKIEGFDFGSNAKGSVKVYVDNANPPAGTRPKIVSLSSVESPGQSAVTKMIEITLARRSPFANGLTARESITFSGARATVDSWNSDPDNDPTTPAVPYAPPIRNDRGTVAAKTLVNTAALLNQATVWGFVSTGGDAPEVGSKGLIGPFGTPEGTIHPGRVSTDFVANFPDIEAPEGGTVLATFGDTLGTAGMATQWRASHLHLKGKQTLTILGDVTLVLTGGLVPSIEMDDEPSAPRTLAIAGRGSLIIPEGSSLVIYLQGDAMISGNGVANANASPASLRIYGVGENRQTLSIVGNGILGSVVNAPHATFTVKGNASLLGAVLAEHIEFKGNVDFHYDEALANFDIDQPFGTREWRSLSDAESRARHEAVFSKF